MTESEAPRTEMTCPRCGSARSKSAAFCGVCGQDLRPGALVVPLPPPGATPAPAPEAGKGRLSGLRRGKSGEPTPPAPAWPGEAGSSALAPPGLSATAPVTLPGSQTPLPKEAPAQKSGPAVVPQPDTTLSFSERYRGTQYSNPDIERFLPPPKSASGGRRGLRIVVVIVILLALVAAAAAGGWLLFLSPAALIAPSGSAPGGAPGSATPRPTPQPTPTVHGLVADEAEIVACRLIGEAAPQGTALDAIRADVAARTIDGLPARMADVTSAMALSATDLPTLEAVSQTTELAAAYRSFDEQTKAAFDAVVAAGTSAKALKKALKPLDAARASYQAVVEAQQALVDTYPEASCLIEP